MITWNYPRVDRYSAMSWQVVGSIIHPRNLGGLDLENIGRVQPDGISEFFGGEIVFNVEVVRNGRQTQTVSA